MSEWRVFEGDSAAVSTAEFHAHRGRAPHLEQSAHRPRLIAAARLIRSIAPASVVDLGCGDGGLLSLLDDFECWGYDFAPANADGWAERGVTAELRDVFTTRDVPQWGELVVVTEVLEHLTDPHGVVDWIAQNARYVVASSPRFETGAAHDDVHAWCWDETGYDALFSPSFEVTYHQGLDWSQLYAGRSRRFGS